MIIDASVAFKWLVEEPGSAVAIGWIGRVELTAPTLIHAEVANGLCKLVRRGEIVGGDKMMRQLEQLVQLVETFDEIPVMTRAVEIAIQVRHSIYDCIYLALAEARDTELLTADKRFTAKLSGTSSADRVVAFDR